MDDCSGSGVDGEAVSAAAAPQHVQQQQRKRPRPSEAHASYDTCASGDAVGQGTRHTQPQLCVEGEAAAAAAVERPNCCEPTVAAAAQNGEELAQAQVQAQPPGLAQSQDQAQPRQQGASSAAAGGGGGAGEAAGDLWPTVSWTHTREGMHTPSAVCSVLYCTHIL